jgi:signal transduction histidine kinase
MLLRASRIAVVEAAMMTMTETAECAIRPNPSRRATSPRILVIDDDPDYALLVVESLEDNGRFATTVAETAKEARSHNFGRFDAIILDNNLPDASGLELLSEILGVCETPVVMLTGENLVETAVKAIRGGALSYLVKTAENLDVLPEIVGQAVEEIGRRKERRQMQAQMRRAENLAGLGSLATGMCHEMNNPLAAIMGTIDLYRQGIEDDVQRCMDDIQVASGRLRDVVRSLASFAYGSTPPQDLVDVLDVVREVMEEQRARLEEAGIEVALESEEEVLEVTGNGPGLKQVFHRLLVNAFQAFEGGDRKTVVLRVSRSGERARIEVSDNGPGVPADIRDRIFEPFFTTRDPDKGKGMGLAISHKIVRDHCGRLWHEPSPLGGALFVVEIPVSPETVEGATTDPQQSRGGPDAGA